MKLFKNKNYTVLLIVGFICYFYQNAMNYYAPIGAMQVMGASTSAAGALQMPRTLITIILPTIAGAWVGKKAANAWKAMVIGTSLAMIPMAVMALVTNSGASIMIYFVALAVTGIAESFRAVSITPTAQAMLAPEDMGIQAPVPWPPTRTQAQPAPAVSAAGRRSPAARSGSVPPW